MTAHDVIDLGIGQPDNAILPRQLLRRAAMESLAVADNDCLQYGPEEGTDSFRGALSDFLARHYGLPVVADELLVTYGASHGLDLVLSCFTSPGDTVVVEAPTYFFGLDILRDHRVRVLPVPVDADGLDVDALRDLLRREVPVLVYTIPTFQNPTGVTLSPARRRRLADLAEEYGFLVVADEVYQLVADPGHAPLPLRGYGREQIVSLGSFSKILGPGVRLGWIECAPPILAKLRDHGMLRSGGGASPMTTTIIEWAIQAGLQDRFLKEIRDVYHRRRRHAIDVLSATLPDEVKVRYPDGGYYLWLELPTGIDTQALQAEAIAAGVNFRPGAIFSVDGSFTNSLRLCFTYYDEPSLTVAIERLTKLLRTRRLRPERVGA